jgi:hypothetical protein
MLEKVGSNQKEGGSLMTRAAAWCNRLLDVMVWTKLISESSRNRITMVCSECSDLIPGILTLLMPGYFTSYGVIYVQLAVPLAHSSISVNAMNHPKTNTEILNKMHGVSRYLQYWILEKIMSWILSSFSPILVWVPFNRHFVLLLFAYVQLEGTTRCLYNILESDLVSFGILHAHSHCDVGNVHETVTMRVLTSFATRISNSLPSQNSIEEKEKHELNKHDSKQDSKKGELKNSETSDRTKEHNESNLLTTNATTDEKVT